MTETKLTPKQQEVITTIRNLRKLTAETGTATTRTVNELLRSLPSSDLCIVANCLATD
jgi:hypothetical protein